MNHRQALEEIERIRLVPKIWQKIDSGFYPEIDQEIKLINIQQKINANLFREGFWSLVDFLVEDFFRVSPSPIQEEIKELIRILKQLDDQEQQKIKVLFLLEKEFILPEKEK